MNWSIWRPALLFLAALVIATVAVLGFRGQTSYLPPREFAKGMEVQPKVEAQGATAAFADGRVNRMPPAGTIPLEGVMSVMEEPPTVTVPCLTSLR